MLVSNIILNEYALRRERNIAELEERKLAAYKKLPRVEQLEKEKNDLAFSPLSKATIAAVRKKLGDINGEIERLLKSADLPPDYLELKYDCEICRDTGYTQGDQKTQCACLKQRLMADMLSGSAITGKENFGVFDQSIFSDKAQLDRTKKILNICMDYCANFPDNEVKNLLFMGDPGLGKTFFVNSVAFELTGRGFTVANLTAYGLINGIMENIRENRRIDGFMDADLLIIDDLGREAVIRNVTVEHIFSIINERLSADKPIIISTHLGPSELEDIYGATLVSRITAPGSFKALKLMGSDLRFAKKK